MPHAKILTKQCLYTPGQFHSELAHDDAGDFGRASSRKEA
jgi:hypothetical protein